MKCSDYPSVKLQEHQTGIMTDRETPLAEIVEQMSLSKKYTDVLTQSWVFISVNDDLTNWQGVYIHIEWRELKAGDDANGNNVVEGGANNRSNVCTSCTNDDNENKYGHVLMSIGYYHLH